MKIIIQENNNTVNNLTTGDMISLQERMYIIARTTTHADERKFFLVSLDNGNSMSEGFDTPEELIQKSIESLSNSMGQYKAYPSKDYQLALSKKDIKVEQPIQTTSVREAKLNELLEEVTDYEQVILEEEQYKEILKKAETTYSIDDIGQIINIALMRYGYKYNDEECKWELSDAE